MQRDSARDERDSARSERDVLQGEVDVMTESLNLREDFVSTLTHDLRNPVGTIKAAIDLFRYEENRDKFSTLIDLIDRNADLAMDLISHLLDANLIKSGIKLPLEKSRCNLVTILQKCVKSTVPNYQKRIVLESEMKEEIWGHWDPLAMERVFRNLLSNAIKYSRENTPINIKILQDNEMTIVCFKNFGKVISLADQLNIFDNHFRSTNIPSNKLKGWGLGLTLVKGITESHGGKVEVTSSKSEGTVFTVRLPNE